MMTHTTVASLMASALSLLLVSCSASRDTTRPAPEELTRYVLIIEESPGGQVTHRWQSAEDFNLWHYRYQSRTRGTDGRIVLVSGRERDCDAETGSASASA